MDPLDCSASCPFLVDRAPALGFPVGQLHRVAAAKEEVDETRRNVLKLAAVAGVLGVGIGGAVGGGLQYAQPPPIGLSSYPPVQLLDVDGAPLTVDRVDGGPTPSKAEYNVETSSLYLFNYPLRNEPNFLLNLYPKDGNPPSPTNPGAQNVPGGIGTHGSIVAFSAICQHLGCPAPAIAYYPPVGTLGNPCSQKFQGGSLSFYIHCSCHGSTYDPTNSAANLTGPAVLPLPQVTLKQDSNGNILAINVTGPPVNGHLNTLQGDYGVGPTSQLQKEVPVILCNFPT